MKSINIGNLTLKMPVIQGGMGVGISLSGLASAVANEGGVGVISSAGLGLLYKNFSADYLKASIYGLKEEIRKAREKSNGIIGVNVMVAMSNFADMVRTAIQEKADVIFSGAGLPLDMPSFLKSDSTTKLVPIVSSARAAKIICQKWKNLYNYLPDAIVVEGPKAGGHLGYKEDQINDVNFSLEKTIPEVVKVAEEYKAEKTIPVFAAGGIYTGEDMSRIMELGASGVQMGTRFVTTNECDASDAFKQAYINAEEKDIEIIKSPVGMPGRAIWNNFIQRMKDGNAHPKSCVCHCIKTCDSQKSPYCIIMALYNAFKGNLDKGYAFAGSNAFRAKSIESVKDIFNSLKTEYENYQKKKQQ
ncbi:MAG TPA: nitronate monooxygenase family protein [Paludibacteraceae bacterium]|nr:nitronate monooxygenase family protein [Paludibacteraceae bacterium]HQF49222.1 nitronate monooxygenase family protein [Paludibacteraceae bacterium]